MSEDKLSPETVFREHRDYLFLLARCLIRRLGIEKLVTTEDILQEAWLRFSRTFDPEQFESPKQILVWAKKCVHSIVVDQWRREHQQMRDRRRVTSVEELLDRSSIAMDNWLAASQTSPSRAASRDEDIRRVSAAIRNLADDIREVIICRYMMELSRAETAASLGITANEVDYRTAVGLKKLKGFLE